MTTKTVLYEDKGGFADLQKEVYGMCLAANNLIENYNQYAITRVTTLQDIENLIADPVLSFDAPLLAKMAPIEGLTPDPEQAAKMYNIPRQDFLISVFGAKAVRTGSCISCLVDVEILTDYNLHRRYLQYADYLSFKNSMFTVDQSKIDQAKESFTTYASPEQETALKELELFVSLCNKLADCGILKTEDLQNMKQFSYDWNNHRLNLPYDKLQLVSKLNNLKS